jgi:hypothetical protein
MKRTTLFITIIMTAALLAVLAMVLPASATAPREPIALPNLQPLSAAQPIGTVCNPEAPLVVEANTFETLINTSKDAFVRQAAPTTNYSNTTYLRAGRILGTDEYQVLTQFDISALPANAAILTATLEMYTPVSSTPSLRAYAVLDIWGEASVTWNTKPTASTEYGPQTGTGLGWHKWDVTALAQQWKAGTLANNGLILVQVGTTFGTRDYDSRENASLRIPRLRVVYATQGSPAILPVQADTWINQSLPSNNYGSDTILSVDGGSSAHHALLKFDTSSLPSSLVVISASLELYSEINLLNAPEAATDIYADAVIGPWDETTVTWNSKPLTQTMGDPASAYAIGWMRWDVSNIVRGWYSGTISNHGIQLRPDPAHTTNRNFSALPSPKAARLTIAYHTCVAPLTNVTISGATSGVTGTQYTFTARPSPSKPTAPITYTWRATGLICGGIHQDPCPTSATFPFTFTTVGTKFITLTAKNCGGTTFTDTHQIVISAPPPGCPNPVSDVSVIGISQGLTGTNYTFTATASPINATTPITFTWEATDQAPQTTSGVVTQTARTYSWSGTGAKTVTVTVQNCGGSVQTTKAVDIVPPSALPDLWLSSAWYDAALSKIGYVLKNIGGSDAEPAGYNISAYQDNVFKAQTIIGDIVPPGGIRSGYIDHAWMCPGVTATMKLHADPANLVLEGNTANNVLSEAWACQQTMPQVLNVKVIATTEHTATIQWMVDRPVQYAINYGTYSGSYPFARTGNSSGTLQTTQLTGLASDHTYHFTIVVTDNNGRVVNTPEYVLETKAACSDLPVLSNLSVIKWPATPYEYYLIRAQAADPTCVDRVTFSMDGIVLGADYTPDPVTNVFNVYFSPAYLNLTRSDFFKAHTFKAEVRNKQGAAGTPLTNNVTPATTALAGDLQLFTPQPDYTVYVAGATAPPGETLPISGKAYQFEWACTWGPTADDLPEGMLPVLCDDVKAQPHQVSMSLTGSPTFLGGTTATNGFEHAYSIANKPIGTYTLKVCARSTSAELDCAEQPVHITQGSPTMIVTRTITRQGNFFRVDLGVKNNGNVDAYLTRLSDEVLGFQPSDRSFSANTAISTYYRPATHQADVDMTFQTGSDAWLRLSPGSQRTLSYVMIPLMYQADAGYAIGSSDVVLCYRSGSGSGPSDCQSFPLGNAPIINGATGASEALVPALYAAFGSSDYLLTTNPTRLFDFYTDTDVPPVLASMATLAYYKNGVIGYLDTYDVNALDNIVEKNGAWKQVMHPDFFVKNKGYVLIVGETEIVPAWYVGPGNFTTWPGIPDKVHHSDLRYADTAGETARPELVVGRIVGDNPQYLITGMSGAIAVADGTAEFDRSHALVVSGRGSGVTSNFIPTVDIIEDVLTDNGVNTYKIHSYYASDPVGEFNANTANRDVWFYRDHGCEDCWSGVLGTSDVMWRDLGNTRPVAFAAACLAGNYEDTDDVNLPDEMMNKGVGAYIGSTEISNRPTNDFASKYFFRHWPLGQSVGVALNNARIAVWDDDGATYDNGKLWAFEYGLYGDPKFGLVPGVAAAADAASPIAPATTLEVHVPNYEVERVDGTDRVSIPGGLLRLEPGRYEVPYWQVTLDYPQGTRVASITLEALASPVITSGLQLITNTSQMDCAGCPELPPPPLLDTANWVPPLDPKFEWSVDVNPDGSSTLFLKVYPFFYNPTTTDVQFYQDFTFNVNTYPVPVSIVEMETDQTTYPINGSGVITLLLNNAGASADFFVDAAIVQPVSGDVVSGLLLKSVHALSGTASLQLPFSGSGIPTGDYAIRVRVLDAESRVMDSATTAVALGIRSGVVTTLSAPTFFKPGQSIDAALTFNNAGDIALNGVAYIEVYPSGSVTRTAIFTQTISNLQPAQSITFPAVWNTTGVSNGDYRLIGYVKYTENLTSNAQEVALSTTAKVYLPLVLR